MTYSSSIDLTNLKVNYIINDDGVASISRCEQKNIMDVVYESLMNCPDFQNNVEDKEFDIDDD